MLVLPHRAQIKSLKQMIILSRQTQNRWKFVIANIGGGVEQQRKNKSQTVRKLLFSLCEVVASKVLCYIQETVACKNRYHVIFRLAHGGE